VPTIHTNEMVVMTLQRFGELEASVLGTDRDSSDEIGALKCLEITVDRTRWKRRIALDNLWLCQRPMCRIKQLDETASSGRITLIGSPKPGAHHSVQVLDRTDLVMSRVVHQRRVSRGALKSDKEPRAKALSRRPL
jgi:hypothetical protein